MSTYYKHIVSKHNKLVLDVKTELETILKKRQEELEKVLKSYFGRVEDFVGIHMEDDTYAKSQGYKDGVTCTNAEHDSVFLLNQDLLSILSTIQEKIESGDSVTMEIVEELEDTVVETEQPEVGVATE